MSESTGDPVTRQIHAPERVAQLEIDVARLSAELDEARGDDPTASASRFLNLAAATIDQAIGEVRDEADAAVQRAQAEIDQRQEEAQAEAAAARAEAEAARDAAAQVTIGARQELEKARMSAMAAAEEAAAAAEETQRDAETEAQQIIARARSEASKAMVHERDRFAREVDALTGVREALVKERNALERYHAQLQDRVRDLARAMVAFMTSGSSDGSLDPLDELTTPEIEPPPEPVTTETFAEVTELSVGGEWTEAATIDQANGEWEAMLEDAIGEEAVGDDEHAPVEQASVEQSPVERSPEAAIEDEDDESPAAEPTLIEDVADVTDEDYPVETHEASFAATTADSPAPTADGSAGTEISPDDPAAEAALAVDDALADTETGGRPEDLFSDSFGADMRDDIPTGEFGPRPAESRPVVEAVPPPPPPPPPPPTPMTPAVDPVAEMTGIEQSETDPDDAPTISRPLFGAPIEPSVMAAVRENDAELFGAAQPDEGPSADGAGLRPVFSKSGLPLLAKAVPIGSDIEVDEASESRSDEDRFQDFIDGDDDDASRLWLLRNDDS